jgi:hypothetical protein
MSSRVTIPRPRAFVAALALVALSGCASLGPRTSEIDRLIEWQAAACTRSST